MHVVCIEKRKWGCMVHGGQVYRPQSELGLRLIKVAGSLSLSPPQIDQGPGASSFECPSKVGWLYKHGGSGVSSHWRKRWFVADHHYLFYYKGPNVSLADSA